jgi:N-acetylmuramoyl-L-alanine amidase
VSNNRHDKRARLRRPVVAACLLVVFSILAAQGQSHGQSSKTATQKKADKCDRGTFRTILDVGHTAYAPGAISARGVGEFDFNLRLARRIEAELLTKDFAKTIVLFRTGPNRAGLLARVAAANAARGDLLISVHHDSVPDDFIEKWEYEGAEGRFSDRFNGHSIFVSVDNPHYARSLAFARELGLALKARGLEYTPHYTLPIMKTRRRVLVDPSAGVYRFDQLIMLKGMTIPAVLLEGGSIINRDEELVMESPERQALVASAVAEAVVQFCEKAPIKKR